MEIPAGRALLLLAQLVLLITGILQHTECSTVVIHDGDYGHYTHSIHVGDKFGAKRGLYGLSGTFSTNDRTAICTLKGGSCVAPTDCTGTGRRQFLCTDTTLICCHTPVNVVVKKVFHVHKHGKGEGSKRNNKNKKRVKKHSYHEDIDYHEDYHDYYDTDHYYDDHFGHYSSLGNIEHHYVHHYDGHHDNHDDYGYDDKHHHNEFNLKHKTRKHSNSRDYYNNNPKEKFQETYGPHRAQLNAYTDAYNQQQPNYSPHLEPHRPKRKRKKH